MTAGMYDYEKKRCRPIYYEGEKPEVSCSLEDRQKREENLKKHSVDVNEIDILKKFGYKVRCLRINKNLRQKDLAILTNLHHTYICSLEMGERNVSLINLKKICLALQCEEGLLLGDGEIPEKYD